MQTHAEGRITVTPGRIAGIRLTAPDRRNAMSQAMWAALPRIAAALDPGTRAVILSAEGPVFSAGADIAEFDQTYATPAATAAYNALVRAGQQALADIPCPVIAAVQGAAVGGGCGLCLSADLILASPGARFGITPARLGLAYSWADTTRLVARVGPGAAKDMLFTGRLIGADEALRLRLIDRIADDPEGAARALADEIAALSSASQQAAKATVDGIAHGAPREKAQALIDAAFSGPDFAEGRAAFKARRPPQF
jgi:enoyl-CoA hydratase/carnithine racemase